MRDSSEIEKRLLEVQDGLAFWLKEVRESNAIAQPEYGKYAKSIISQLRKEVRVLRWVLGDDVELPPTT